MHENEWWRMFDSPTPYSDAIRLEFVQVQRRMTFMHTKVNGMQWWRAGRSMVIPTVGKEPVLRVANFEWNETTPEYVNDCIDRLEEKERAIWN